MQSYRYTVYAGHVDVGDDEHDVVRIVDKPQCLATLRCLQHVKSIVGKRLDNVHSDQRLVFGHQNFGTVVLLLVLVFKNVWPALSASDLSRYDLVSLRQRIRSQGMTPWPRWRSARSGPHKTYGGERHFLNQVSRTPIDCQAISFNLPQTLFSR
jgi:hypothetical protein